MTKKYENPMLQIVSINKNNIIATSGPFGSNGTYGEGVNLAAPGQRGLDDWDAGY